MKYDFETIIDRDPAIRGTGKYRIMKDSKGNKPPKGIVPPVGGRHGVPHRPLRY